jgi:hypothetical protein
MGVATVAAVATSGKIATGEMMDTRGPSLCFCFPHCPRDGHATLIRDQVSVGDSW